MLYKDGIYDDGKSTVALHTAITKATSQTHKGGAYQRGLSNNNIISNTADTDLIL